MKKSIAMLLAGTMAAAALMGCGSASGAASSASSTAVSAAQSAASTDAAEEESTAASVTEAAADTVQFESTTVTVFAAKSLNTVMQDIIAAYNEIQPNVEIVGSYDSSGTLMTQIQEGAACDVFFSAAQKQMNTLEEAGYLVDGTRADIVNNQVVVVTYKDSGTTVTGLDNIGDAASFALADGSVPVGRYTRTALMNLGVLAETDDASAYTTEEVSQALGGIEINECGNVGAVATAVSEGSNEVGTVYYSDTYGLEDQLVVLETVSYDLTGNVIYPAAQIKNAEADETEAAAAADFTAFLSSDTAKAIFDAYYFDTNVG
ncbi:MAG: molybdate ABC transporter substrate-binding protein [Lachnospiraceae bacterium]|nr:molybdate ABC transporter substrate-binding protein [Lachnospiraceae bacterium]